MAMFSSSGSENTEEGMKAMREMLGPQAVTRSIDAAISMCWMMLPEGKKNIATVEAEIRRVVDRALANLREDASAFGIPAEE